MGKIDGAPPFELTNLSLIPQSLWMGLPVFHPCCQRGNLDVKEKIELFWQDPDFAENVNDPLYYDDFHDEDGNEVNPTTYDVGVIVGWTPAYWRGSADLPGTFDVSFLGDNGSTLQYGAYNLWVPKKVADIYLKFIELAWDK